ncbi:TPA: preprotein translocase subunit SecG [bacterium]|nr:preprotein translocase subunit SecG [bacterium]
MLDIVFLIIAVLLIVITLLQGGKTDGASGAIMGGNLNIFTDTKERGPEVIIIRFTMFLGILYFLLAIIIHLVAK